MTRTRAILAATAAVLLAVAGVAISQTYQGQLPANTVLGNGTGGALPFPTPLTTIPTATMPALTGDVTSSAGTVATTIAAGAVTGSKIASGTVAGSNIATNTVANSNLTQAAANTMKGNWTGSTANEADNTMPSCPDSGSNHLNYVNGTGVICGTADISAGAWSAYTPSPSCGSATFTVNSARFKTVSKTTFAEIDITISTLGTCTVTLNFNLPATSNSSGSVSGQETTNTGKGFTCQFGSAATATALCRKADGSNFSANDNFKASWVYENQ